MHLATEVLAAKHSHAAQSGHASATHSAPAIVKIIDFRSDTVTKPTPAMRKAMAQAEVGDDVYGEDPTVNRLEAIAAEMLGKEAALFVSSGTQGNLLGLLAHCERGDEYIVGGDAHTYKYEAGGAAVLGSIQPQPLPFESDGTLDLDAVVGVIKPDDCHFARTRLLCLENTQKGMVLSLEYLRRAEQVARGHGLALHMDGARVFNAAVKLGCPLTDITSHVDSISVCLSKGLGAPVGSILGGNAELVSRARRMRKMLGGGMRQAGIIAAAGIVALRSHVERLADDHANATRLAKGLCAVAGAGVDPALVQTNMVFANIGGDTAEALSVFLRDRDILVSPAPVLRLVTHLDIDAADVDRSCGAIAEFFAARAA